MESSLASFHRSLTDDDSKQNVPFKVQVPAGTAQLNIRLTFSPATVDSVKNLLTLTVFDPSGWRGAGHRGGNTHQVFIGPDNASPGFLPGSIPPGEWTVVVDTHLIMPGPPLELHLQISAANEPAVSAVLRLPSSVSRLPSSAPRRSLRGPGWYRGDLHAHTIHSDARWDVAELVDWSRERGLDFATLSDHNTVSALAEMDASTSDDLLTMGGMELTTFWGHALALGLREWVDWRVRKGERTMYQIASEVEALGGLFIIAHPMHLGDPFCTGCMWEYEDMMPGAAEAVEVWNGPWAGKDSNNEASLALAYRWLNQGHRLALTAGADNHGRAAGTSTILGLDVVYAEALSEREILRAVRAGHLYLSSGPRLELGALAGSRRAALGEVLDFPPGAPARIIANWGDCPEGAQLSLIADGESRETLTVGATGSQMRELREARWCLATLRDREGVMLALTNPIYFQ